jgi:peptidoglycan/xylan/chitin deacetylase (PgdA/CDA1 family)
VLKNIFKSLKTTFIFCYHRVIPNELVKTQCVNRAMYVTPDTFDRHIRWMKTAGEIIDHNEILNTSSGPRFVITFDDGWKDNFIYALPILQKYDARAIIFISTDSIDRQKLFWSEEVGIVIKRSLKTDREIISILQQLSLSAMKLVEHRDREYINSNWNSDGLTHLLDRFVESLKVLSGEKRDYFLNLLYSALGASQPVSTDILLTWDEIRSMQKYKISLGSHTHTHPILDRMDETTIDKELCISKQILESRIGGEINLFSYPNGCFRSNYIQYSLNKFGYKYAFTLERSPVWIKTDPFLIPRCLVYEDIATDLDKYCWKLVMNSYIQEGVSRAKRLYFTTQKRPNV